MVSRNQFETVTKLIASGVNNYVAIRQQAGLTSDELDDILDNMHKYKKHFEELDRLRQEEELKKNQKKHWWQR